MNIFSKEESFIGANEICKNISIRKIFELTSDIRTRLGKQGYLLDQYISLILEAANSKLIFDAATEGFEAGSRLCILCKAIVNGEMLVENHPFYEIAKKKISENPLPYQEKTTKVNVYFSMLAEEYPSFANAIGISPTMRKKYLTFG